MNILITTLSDQGVDDNQLGPDSRLIRCVESRIYMAKGAQCYEIFCSIKHGHLRDESTLDRTPTRIIWYY